MSTRHLAAAAALAGIAVVAITRLARARALSHVAAAIRYGREAGHAEGYAEGYVAGLSRRELA